MTRFRARLRRLRPQRLRKPLFAAAVAALALSLTFLTLRGTTGGAIVDPPPGVDSGPRPGLGLGIGIERGKRVELGNHIELDGPGLLGDFAFDRGATLRRGDRTVSAELRLRAKESDAVGERSPIAMAIVVDTSGSMSGEKIVETREAVLELLERMHPDDRVAIVSYSSTAKVVQSLAPVREARRGARSIVESLLANGGTNIPAGLDAGAVALSFAPSTWIRRMVLISDGNDGSGLSLERVCTDIRRRTTEGSTLSSVGIGIDYSERYMSSVADAGNGNYVFLATGSALDAFLQRELDETAATAIDRTVAELELPEGWSLQNVYGAEFNATGRHVSIPLGALRADNERRAILRFDVRTGEDGPLATPKLTLSYRTTADDEHHRFEAKPLTLRVVSDPAEVEASSDREVLAATGAAHIESEQASAVEAWQRGDLATARSKSAEAAVAAKALQRSTKSAAAAPLAGWIEAESALFDAPKSEESELKARAFGAARRSRARSADRLAPDQGAR